MHVIQIGNSFYDVIPISRCQYSHNRCRGFHIRESSASISNTSLSSANQNAHVNPSFVIDEESGGVFPSGKRQAQLIIFDKIIKDSGFL